MREKKEARGLMKSAFGFRLTPAKTVLLGFLGLILVGTCLLMMPAASVQAGGVDFLTAFFTATSATCVTGLVVMDTVTSWTLFGQVVILALIQIGGMGVVTVAVSLTQIAGRRIGLASRFFLQESMGAPQLGGIIRLLRFILRATLIVEGAGACLFAIRFIPRYGPLRGIWYSVFHSISAFCNAGFDLMGRSAPFSSLTGYVSDPLVNFTAMALIIVGGIGFFVWEDLVRNKYHFRSYTLQTKVVLITTALLIALPTLWFFFCEFDSWDMPLGQRFLASLFQAVTPRTAGFNTVDLSALNGGSKLLTICLMLVGGSPSSTAGGLKTTTLAVLLLSVRAGFKGNNEVHCYGRRIPQQVVVRALMVAVLYGTLFLAAGLCMSQLEPILLSEAIFECASAIGTVGLTLGVTTQLCTASKVILILLMYFGRVGGLTLVYAVSGGTRRPRHSYPEESIGIG